MMSVLPSRGSGTAHQAIRFSVFYGAYFLQIGVALPFWPLLLSAHGLSAAEIGLILAATPAARVVIGPLIGFAVDRFRLGRGFLALLGVLCALGVTAIGFVEGFTPILLLALLAVPLYSCLLPVVDSQALHVAARDGLDFGRVRLWGSAAFILANLFAGGVLVGRGSGTILALIVAGTLVGTAALPILPPRPRNEADEGPHVDWRAALGLLRRPAFLTVLLIAGGIQATHAMLYSFGSLAWRAQGLNETGIGGLWALGVLAEIVLLSQSKRLLRLFGAPGLIVFGGGAAMLRWSLLALEPGLSALLGLQLLHAFTFAATYIGAVHLVHETVPPALGATAQATYASVSGGVLYSLVAATLGPLYARYGAGAYVDVAALAGICTIAGAVLFRRLDLVGRRGDTKTAVPAAPSGEIP